MWFQLSVGAVHGSSYLRLLTRNLPTVHLQQPAANFCQARTVCRPALYSDASYSGKVICRQHLVPSSHAFHAIQQKSLLSLSAAVSAAGTADVVCGSNSYFIFIG